MDVTSNLIHSVTAEKSFEYLNVFSLSFKMDGLPHFSRAVLGSAFCPPLQFPLYAHEKKPVRLGVNYFSSVSSSLPWPCHHGFQYSCLMLSWEAMSLSSFFLVIYNHEASTIEKPVSVFVFSHVGAMFILAPLH